MELLELIKEAIYNKEYKINNVLIMCNLVIALILFVILGILFYEKKFSYKKVFNHKYYREIPSLTPSEVSYLINNRKITNDAMSSEILMLFAKKYISVTKVGKKDYLFTNLVYRKKSCSDRDKRLLKLIFDGNKEIKLSKFKKSFRKNHLASSLIRNFIDDSIESCEKKKFFERTNLSKVAEHLCVDFLFLLCLWPLMVVGFPIFLIILFIMAIVQLCKFKDKFKIIAYFARFIAFVFAIVIVGMFIVAIYYSNFIQYGIVSSVLVFILLIITYSRVLYRNPLTETGKKYYGEVMAFKNFLNDFSTMDEKDLPEIALWEQYMAYAVCLGCADKVENVMRVKYDQLQVDVNDVDIFTDITFRTSFNRTVTKSITKAKTYSVSSGGSSGSYSGSGRSYSSGGRGYGGSFSSGGGFRSSGGSSFGGGRRF